MTADVEVAYESRLNLAREQLGRGLTRDEKMEIFCDVIGAVKEVMANGEVLFYPVANRGKPA